MEGVKSQVTIINQVKEEPNELSFRMLGTDMNHKFRYRYINTLLVISLHAASIYALYVTLFGGAKLATVIWSLLITVITNQTIVIGTHRGYSHNCFTMAKPLEIIIFLFQTMAGEGSIYWWVRNHRLHHKFADTDADPHNSKRGFFFAHMKWYMVERHPLVYEKGRTIDMSDLESNKLVMFQRRYFAYINIIFGAFLIMVPIYAWNELFLNSLSLVYAAPITICLQTAGTIASVSHLYGTKPIDNRMQATHSKLVQLLTGGEGWHNYHHCFPWDYGVSDFGFAKGPSIYLIELLAYFGLLHGLKKASPELVRKHAKRHGDGTLFR